MQGGQIRVRGQVKRFRPFVWQLAHTRGLRGLVLNNPEGVVIRVLGEIGDLAEALRVGAPPLARVDAVKVSRFFFDRLPEGFAIVASEGAGAKTRVTPDAATCPECRAEVCGGGWRHGYAFINCTHCGPRFTILKGPP